jgi:hypothetical protein
MMSSLGRQTVAHFGACLAVLPWVAGCASPGHRAIESAYIPNATALRHRLESFAADSMLDRDALNGAGDRASDYLALEAARAGLAPAGENGGWFQTLHLFARRLSPESRIIAGDSVLIPVRDFKVFPVGAGQPRAIRGVQTIYGGIVGDSTTQIGAGDAAGRVVVLGVPSDMTAERVYRDVSYGPNSRFGRAAGVAIASLDYLGPAQRGITTSDGLLDSTQQRATTVPSSILLTHRAASLMLGTDVSGAARGMIGKTLGGQLVVEERDIPTRNVIAVLKGSDPALAATYVALGAHSDHLGLSIVSFNHDSLRNAATARRGAGPGGTAIHRCRIPGVVETRLDLQRRGRRRVGIGRAPRGCPRACGRSTLAPLGALCLAHCRGSGATRIEVVCRAPHRTA